MAGLTPGKIYFIESEAAQQNWLHDPDNIVIGNFTEGIHYIQIDIPRNFTRVSQTGIVVTPSGAGKSFAERNESRFYRALQRGIQTSLANANIIDKFVMAPRHTSGAIGIYKDYYLIVYFGTNLHLEFTDSDGTPRSYCKGVILKATTVWIDSESLIFLVRFQWESEW